MSPKNWVLTDVDRDIHLDDWQASAGELGDASGATRVAKRTLRGGLRDGVGIVEVEHGGLKFVVLPDRGMGLWRVWRGDVELGWPSPVKGPVNPRYVPTDAASGIGWLTGFDEFLCRCGLEYNGPPEWDDAGRLKHTLHGRIANLPAHRLEVAVEADGRIAVTGVVDEARLFGNNLRLASTVRTRIGEPRLWITDQVTNLSSVPADLELLYHINMGPPLAAPGSKVYLPLRRLAPRDAGSARGVADWQTYEAEQPGVAETVLYFELAADRSGNTAALITDPRQARGASLAFNCNQLPRFIVWKNPQPRSDGYCTGLEPAINFPNVKSFEKAQGRVLVLAPGESRVFEIEIRIHGSEGEVLEARRRIEALQGGIAPEIHSAPLPGWSP
ncbi:MAG: aldose 1-epimerase family protein [Pirellulales bacterium]